MAETLETAHTWSGLHGLYEAVTTAIATSLLDQGTPGVVMCHLSHAYRDGASLYYTFLAPRKPGAELSSGEPSSPPPARRSRGPGERSPTTTGSAATTCRT